MKDFESLTVISVETTVRLTLSALHISKWLTVENIDFSKRNLLHYFNKVIEKLHYLLHFK